MNLFFFFIIIIGVLLGVSDEHIINVFRVMFGCVQVLIESLVGGV